MKKRRARSSNPRGLAPPADTRASMAALGYYVAAELAKKYDVAASTIYDWIARSKIRAGDVGMPLTIKRDGNLWILGDAVAARVAARAR